VQAGDGADEFSRLRIDGIDARAVGEIEAVGLPIGGQVIPKAISTDLPVVKDFVRLLCGDGTNGGHKAAEQSRGREGPGNKAKRALHGHGKAPGTTGEE
jgi:hypothetical protein